MDSITDFKYSCEKVKRSSIPQGNRRMIQLNINDCIKSQVKTGIDQDNSDMVKPKTVDSSHARIEDDVTKRKQLALRRAL